MLGVKQAMCVFFRPETGIGEPYNRSLMKENDQRCLPPINVQRMLNRIRAYEDFAAGMSIDAAAEKHGVLRSELQETIRIDFQDKLDNLAHGLGDYLGKRTPHEIQEIRSYILQCGTGLVPFESMVEGDAVAAASSATYTASPSMLTFSSSSVRNKYSA